MSYEHTPKGKYIRQAANARNRGIEWQFTFETWMKKWEDSGQWEHRGTKAGQYVMSRFEDKGPYSPENTIIQTVKQNAEDFTYGKTKQSFWDTWQPYPRTNAWEYTYNGMPINRWTEEEQRLQAMRVVDEHGV